MNTKLGRADRVGSLAIGLAIVAYSIMGGYSNAVVQTMMLALGAFFTIGGICGT